MDFLQIYRRLVRLRLIEEAIVSVYDQQEIRCPTHLCIGQEAVAVGSIACLHKDDVILGTHRSHGPYVASGGQPHAMFKELYGKVGGSNNGKGGSMHLVSCETGFWGAVPIVGSALPIATGVAFAFKMQKRPQVSMVLFGEGATEEGVFHESVQYAALKKLPVLYVCENNSFSVNTPLSERRLEGFSLCKLVQGYNIRVFEGDGNDVFSVYNLCQEAVSWARENNGPVFLEFKTYRMLEHCGHRDDHHLPCRDEVEKKRWQVKDPLVLARAYLLEKMIAKPEQLQEIWQEESINVESALMEAQQAPFPQEKTAFGPVYAEGKKYA